MTAPDPAAERDQLRAQLDEVEHDAQMLAYENGALRDECDQLREQLAARQDAQ